MKYLLNFSLLFRNRNFGLLFLGQFVSFIGTMITSVALPYQIYHETHSTLMVGLLGFFQLLPLLFTALVGGVFADRYHRRMLLMITETLLAIGCLLLAWNASLVTAHLWVIFLVSSVMSAINGLHRPAIESMTQQLVDKKDFAQVGALITFKFSLCMIAGPAIGGLIISHYGVMITFFVDFATFFISLIALLLMTHVPRPDRRQEDESTFRSVKKGFKYALSREDLIGTYVVDFIAMVFGMPNALFPAIALSFGGAKTLGLLYSAPAVGALVISAFGGLFEKIKRHGAGIAIAAMSWGVSIICFGLAHHLFLALFFLAMAGLFDGISGIFRMTMWNQTIPTDLRGRMAGIEMISYLSGPRLGDTEAGLVASLFGVTASVISGGVLCVVGVAACCFYLPKFWKYQAK